MPRMMRAKRSVDTDTPFFDSMHRSLSQPDKCQRADVEFVSEQADAFSALEKESERCGAKRMMITLSHPCGYDDGGANDPTDLCDCSLYDRIAERDDLKVKVAATFLAVYFGTAKLGFDEPALPTESNIFGLFIDEPFCDHSAHNIVYHMQETVGNTAFFVETDAVTKLIARYAAEFRRLDQQFHCRALAADLERWEAMPHERGPADPDLVSQHYGNVFRQQHVPQPSVQRFLVPKASP
jgi:hypothetical protein